MVHLNRGQSSLLRTGPWRASASLVRVPQTRGREGSPSSPGPPPSARSSLEHPLQTGSRSFRHGASPSPPGLSWSPSRPFRVALGQGRTGRGPDFRAGQLRCVVTSRDNTSATYAWLCDSPLSPASSCNYIQMTAASLSRSGARHH